MKCTTAAVNHISHWVALLFHSIRYLCWWKFPIKPRMKSKALFTECLIRNWCSIYILNILFRNSSARVCTIFLCSLITGIWFAKERKGKVVFFFLNISSFPILIFSSEPKILHLCHLSYFHSYHFQSPIIK